MGISHRCAMQPCLPKLIVNPAFLKRTEKCCISGGQSTLLVGSGKGQVRSRSALLRGGQRRKGEERGKEAAFLKGRERPRGNRNVRNES